MNKMEKVTDLLVTLHITICIFMSFTNPLVFLDYEISELRQLHIMYSVTETVKWSVSNMNRMSLNCLDCEKKS